MDITAERLQNILFKLLPSLYTDRIEREARYARIDDYKRITFNIYAVFFTGLLVFGLLFQAGQVIKLTVLIIGIPLAFLTPYIVLSLLANRRRKQIEEVLPDALQLVSANIQSGLTIEKAFLLSARDEFGPLADELKRTAMEMFGGKPVDEALQDLAEANNSELFEETLTLLQDGIEAGGKTSQLLESSAKDIQKSLQLRDEIATNVKMYSMFILMAATFGAPILYSLSVFLTEQTQGIFSSQNINFEDLPSTGLIQIKEPSFRPGFFADFSVVAILVSNFFAAILISEIKNGNAKEGFKLIPILITVSLIVYFTSSTILEIVLGGII
jgi:type II secretory pathway component PulF